MSAKDLFQIANLDVQSEEPDELGLSFDVNLPEVSEENQYFEYYVTFLKNEIPLRTSLPNIERVDAGQQIFTVSLFETFPKSLMPGSFQFCYRPFKSSKFLKFELDCPPELNRKSGSFTINTPKKGVFGGGKWKVGSIEVSSVVLQLLDEELYYSLNLVCSKPIESILEVVGSNSENKTINWPILIEAPNMTIERESITGIENITIELKEYIGTPWVESMPVLDLASNVNDVQDSSGNNGDVRRIDFSITGGGSEFQCHRLDEGEAKTLKEMVENGDVTELLGWSWNHSICAGAYGPHIDDLVLTNENIGDEIDVNEIDLIEVEKITDLTGDFEQPHCLDVFYFAPSKVTGMFSVDIEDGEEFDPSELTVKYITYHLDGYPERYGKPILSVEYKGEDVDVEFEDTGGGREYLFVGYQFENDEFVDHIVVFENLFSQDNQVSDANWEMLSRIFETPSEQKKQKVDKNQNINEDADNSNASFFKHNVMLVSIGKSLSEKEKIYDAARYQWKASLKRAKAVEYVIAHSRGKIVGVFKPTDWLVSDDQAFAGLSEPMEGRIGFVGEVAESEVLLEYLNNEIPKSYFPKGAANPVRFIEPS